MNFLKSLPCGVRLCSCGFQPPSHLNFNCQLPGDCKEAVGELTALIRQQLLGNSLRQTKSALAHAA